MTVTFTASNIPFDLDDPTTYLNLANVNALDLMAWLGLPTHSPTDLMGSIPARDLAARCRRRLWEEPRNYDPALPAAGSRRGAGVRVIFCGRRPGYLREKTQELLRLAERAGNGDLRWG